MGNRLERGVVVSALLGAMIAGGTSASAAGKGGVTIREIQPLSMRTEQPSASDSTDSAIMHGLGKCACYPFCQLIG